MSSDKQDASVLAVHIQQRSATTPYALVRFNTRQRAHRVGEDIDRNERRDFDHCRVFQSTLACRRKLRASQMSSTVQHRLRERQDVRRFRVA